MKETQHAKWKQVGRFQLTNQEENVLARQAIRAGAIPQENKHNSIG
jgi:hypothetical protein